MFGASALKIFKFVKAGQLLNFGQLFLLFGCDGSRFCSQHGRYPFLDQLCEKHDFTLFGKYRIVLGSILLLYSFVRLFCIRKALKSQLFKVLKSSHGNPQQADTSFFLV